MLKDLLSQWPLIQQIKTGADGTGPEAMSSKTKNLRTKHHGAEVATSICPYCGVGCGQLVFHKNNKLISIEGDPNSPISRGHLCPKGADTFELHTHPNRLKKVKYRRPYAKEWEELELDQAMDMVADRLWESRNRSFEEEARRTSLDAEQERRASRRSDSRQRRKLSDPKIVYRRIGDGLYKQPGQDMT